MNVQLPPLNSRQAIALVVALEGRHQKLAKLNQTEPVMRALALVEELQAIVDTAFIKGLRE